MSQFGQLPRNCPGEQQLTISIESEEVLQETSDVRIQAIKERAVFAKMLVKQQPVRFQIDCLASASIYRSKKLALCSQTLVM